MSGSAGPRLIEVSPRINSRQLRSSPNERTQPSYRAADGKHDARDRRAGKRKWHQQQVENEPAGGKVPFASEAPAVAAHDQQKQGAGGRSRNAVRARPGSARPHRQSPGWRRRGSAGVFAFSFQLELSAEQIDDLRRQSLVRRGGAAGDRQLGGGHPPIGTAQQHVRIAAAAGAVADRADDGGPLATGRPSARLGQQFQAFRAFRRLGPTVFGDAEQAPRSSRHSRRPRPGEHAVRRSPARHRAAVAAPPLATSASEA